jgi:hypothetical protein
MNNSTATMTERLKERAIVASFVDIQPREENKQQEIGPWRALEDLRNEPYTGSLVSDSAQVETYKVWCILERIFEASKWVA